MPDEKPEYPDTIYVCEESEGEDPEDKWLVASPRPEAHASENETVIVAVYRFERYAEVANATTVRPLPAERLL